MHTRRLVMGPLWSDRVFARLIGFGAILFAVVAATAYLFGTPPLTGDEAGHLDYGYEVWHHQLPVFERGLVYRPTFGSILPPVQWVSQHPPLYYVLIAPIVGPLIDAGHGYLALMAGRGFDVVLLGVFIACVWWAARRVFPTRPVTAACAALLAAAAPPILQLGGSLYNDLLALILEALTVGIIAVVLRAGRRTGWVVAACVVAAAGMLSRATYGPFLLGLALALLIAPSAAPAPAAAGPRRGARRVLGGIGAAAAVVASAVAASGWFYLRNLRLTGNIGGGHAQWFEEHMGRVPKSLGQILGDPVVWHSLIGRQYEGAGALTSSIWIGWWLLGTPLVIAAVAGVVHAVRHGVHASTVRIVVVWGVLVVVSLALIMYTQSANANAPQPRYGTSIMPVVVIACAYGLTALGRLSGAACAAWLAAAVVMVWRIYPTSFTRVLPTPHAIEQHLLPAVLVLGFLLAALWLARSAFGSRAQWMPAAVAPQATRRRSVDSRP